MFTIFDIKKPKQDCSAFVKGVSGVKYKKFDTIQQCEDFIQPPNHPKTVVGVKKAQPAASFTPQGLDPTVLRDNLMFSLADKRSCKKART